MGCCDLQPRFQRLIMIKNLIFFKKFLMKCEAVARKLSHSFTRCSYVHVQCKFPDTAAPGFDVILTGMPISTVNSRHFVSDHGHTSLGVP